MVPKPKGLVQMLLAIGAVIIGFLFLLVGGEKLVDGSVELANKLSMTPAVIGVTVVAFGTSVPEIVVSVLAAMNGQPAIAIGNALGSNILNIAAVLGITSIILPVCVKGTVLRIEWPAMFLVTLAALGAMWDGVIERWEGGAFLLTLVIFIVFMVKLARRQVRLSNASNGDAPEHSKADEDARTAVAAIAPSPIFTMLIIVSL